MQYASAIFESNDAHALNGTSICHCDLLAGNVVLTDTEEVEFIDLEYAGIASCGFDIANHFVEFANTVGDYANLYPREDFQREWLSVYYDTRNQQSKENRRRRKQLTFGLPLTATVATVASADVTVGVAEGIGSSKHLAASTPVADLAGKGGSGSFDEAVTSYTASGNSELRLVEYEGFPEVIGERQTDNTLPSTGGMSPYVVSPNMVCLNENYVPRYHLAAAMSKEEWITRTLKEVESFALTSFLLWGTWCMVKAVAHAEENTACTLDTEKFVSRRMSQLESPIFNRCLEKFLPRNIPFN